MEPVEGKGVQEGSAAVWVEREVAHAQQETEARVRASLLSQQREAVAAASRGAVTAAEEKAARLLEQSVAHAAAELQALEAERGRVEAWAREVEDAAGARGMHDC